MKIAHQLASKKKSKLSIDFLIDSLLPILPAAVSSNEVGRSGQFLRLLKTLLGLPRGAATVKTVLERSCDFPIASAQGDLSSRNEEDEVVRRQSLTVCVYLKAMVLALWRSSCPTGSRQRNERPRKKSSKGKLRKKGAGLAVLSSIRLLSDVEDEEEAYERRMKRCTPPFFPSICT